MMDILEVIDRLKDLDYDEIEIEGPDFKLALKRSKPAQYEAPASIAQMGGFTKAKNTKAPGLASDGQVKYCRDVMIKEFGTDEKRMYDFLAFVLEATIDEVPLIEDWDAQLTREMAERILTSWEEKEGINKKR